MLDDAGERPLAPHPSLKSRLSSREVENYAPTVSPVLESLEDVLTQDPKARAATEQAQDEASDTPGHNRGPSGLVVGNSRLAGSSSSATTSLLDS